MAPAQPRWKWLTDALRRALHGLLDQWKTSREDVPVNTDKPMQSGTYPWYTVPTGREITQGDILFGCPILTPVLADQASVVSAGDRISGQIRLFDVVVMTQACDIDQNKVEDIILCPLASLDEIAQRNDLESRDRLRRGEAIGRHLVNATEGFGFHVVDFAHVFSLPKGFVLDFAQKAKRRLRLLPPYREHLAQAFARFFMRVGLPIDIPSFTKKNK
jgi:hypothetical protein